MNMKHFVHYITQRYIKDIIVSGYIDFENTHIFHQVYERFFIFDVVIYEIYMDNYGCISANKINKINL
ncbi:unnamed protein product [Commensalibacter papalotli (ex Botero et al. 2024)]|uniref:Uncharacterized protein n=1 Tax=Commensalibacter papalotli (ex Botero et al. 2024) TaxID=2972766 RepID=A0ABM9HTN1_9PROT|nr:unnamed protein product [Commensalibacter papalotli (ex Botero et al. 2024)]CAI3954875.1 unnamed protein product [Commensalibacter papalotli (ex Botero et al. 2024)]